ncbi:MAG: HDOD domain-containing protein, partial [Pirellulaceae bacterium]
LMPNPKCGPFDLKSLWQDSLRRAIFSRRVGRMLKMAEAEDLFACALLQDMAIPLLAKELPVQYQNLLEARQGGANRLSDLERDMFGWTHGEAGAEIARNWHLPESFGNLIAHHADLPPGVPASPAARVIALSSLLPSTCDSEWTERERFLATMDEVQPGLAANAESLFEDVEADFAEFAPVLKLAKPARPLVDYLRTEPMVV